MSRDAAGAARRHREVQEEWAAAGHPRAACTGHTHPQPGCPAPAVHHEMFPEARPVRSPDLLASGAITLWRRDHGDGSMTGAEADAFMKGRVRAWDSLADDTRHHYVRLNEYLGMSGDELAQWILTGTVPPRVRRIWRLS